MSVEAGFAPKTESSPAEKVNPTHEQPEEQVSEIEAVVEKLPRNWGRLLTKKEYKDKVDKGGEIKGKLVTQVKLCERCQKIIGHGYVAFSGNFISPNVEIKYATCYQCDDEILMEKIGIDAETAKAANDLKAETGEYPTEIAEQLAKLEAAQKKQVSNNSSPA